MEADAAAAQRTLEEVWERLSALIDEARFERRGGLTLALCARNVVPQRNGLCF